MIELLGTKTLLEDLPRALHGGITVRVVTAAGEILRHAGPEDGTRVRNRQQGLVVEPGPGRAAFQRAMSETGPTVVLSFDAAEESQLVGFLEGFFDMAEQKQLVEEDMESIQPSSLALLEEVSMYNDTLPSLSTGSSEIEVAEMGLEALVVAASLNRALYVSYDAVVERCQVLVQVAMDDDGRQTLRIPVAEAAVLLPDDGIIWQAIRGNGEAILRSVPAGQRLGVGNSPEALAERELIAVPVAYGSGDKTVILGVLLIMDKRANAYSNSVRLGSQETKFATAVASMLGSVLGARKVAEFGKELRMAKEIQRQILPDRAARIAGFDLAGRCTNSGAVGGDYFDYLPMKDGRTLVVVADVSGHNLASGMLMVGARSSLRALVSQHGDPGVVFDDLAQALFHDLTRTESFITAVGAALAPGSREIELVNAGHNDSMIYRCATGEIERVPSSATILGFLADSRHDRFCTELEEGDVLLLYTDGVVEATDDRGEMLGEEGLVELLRKAVVAQESAEGILASVLAATDRFSSRSAQSDDVTAVVIKATAEGVEP